MTKDIMIMNLSEIITKQSQEIDKLNIKNQELIDTCEEISLDRIKQREFLVNFVIEEAVKEFQNYLEQEINMDKESEIDSFRHLLKNRIALHKSEGNSCNKAI